VLRKEAVVPEMIDVIENFQKEPAFNNVVLAGGTALALQIGHRTSTDIDLFSSIILNPVLIIKYFKNKYKNTNIAITGNEFMRIFANNVKVEIVHYDEKFIEKPKSEEGIKLFSLNDIAAMKLKAILGRTEARDFIDVAYLLQDISLKNMFDLFKKKYGSISPLYMKRTLLVKSKSIKDNEWLIGIKMLRNDIEPKNIPTIIEKEIEKYNEDIKVG